MFFTFYVNEEKCYEVNLSIKAYKDISQKDVERINKIALLLGSLGSKEDVTEEEYRFREGREKDELLLDVEIVGKK